MALAVRQWHRYAKAPTFQMQKQGNVPKQQLLLHAWGQSHMRSHILHALPTAIGTLALFTYCHRLVLDIGKADVISFSCQHRLRASDYC
jgi:hypothetical protein